MPPCLCVPRASSIVSRFWRILSRSARPPSTTPFRLLPFIAIVEGRYCIRRHALADRGRCTLAALTCAARILECPGCVPTAIVQPHYTATQDYRRGNCIVFSMSNVYYIYGDRVISPPPPPPPRSVPHCPELLLVYWHSVFQSGRSSESCGGAQAGQRGG